MLKDTMILLHDLYERTEMDWNIEIHHCLTEPTCPAVIINPEGLTATRYRVDCTTIEEGVEQAVDRVYREIILGEVVEPMAPFTNPDDAKLGRWIEKWQRGEKLSDRDEPSDVLLESSDTPGETAVMTLPTGYGFIRTGETTIRFKLSVDNNNEIEGSYGLTPTGELAGRHWVSGDQIVWNQWVTGDDFIPVIAQNFRRFAKDFVDSGEQLKRYVV